MITGHILADNCANHFLGYKVFEDSVYLYRIEEKGDETLYPLPVTAPRYARKCNTLVHPLSGDVRLPVGELPSGFYICTVVKEQMILRTEKIRK